MLEAIFILLFSIVWGALGQVFFKQGTKGALKPDRWTLRALASFFSGVLVRPLLWLGILAMSLNFFSWLLLLSRADVSWALPMRSIQYILVALFALIFLKEKVTPGRWAGIGFITAGLFFMLRSWGG